MRYGWFDTQIEHQGRGRAEFVDPAGLAYGEVEIRVGESGRLDVQMRVDSIELDEPTNSEFELLALLTGERPQGSGDQLFLRVGGSSGNTCTGLRVKTDDGLFEAVGTVLYDAYDLEWESTRLVFTLLSARFDAVPERSPRYWAAPLSNFISEYTQRDAELDRHPLRLEPTPIASTGTLQAEKEAFETRHRKPLIRFDYKGGPGFVEALPDHDDRVEALRSGRQRNRLTAVMVGEVGENPARDLEEIEGWFPFDFANLLALATGSEVGSPWVEIRDGDGELVRRIYTRAGAPCYFEGHRAIDETLHRGTGLLLTRAGASPASQLLRESHFRVCVKQAVRAQLRDQPFEEQVAYVFRAMDALCEGRGLKGELKPEDTLDEGNRRALAGIVKEAVKGINNLSQETRKTGKTEEAAALARISQQVSRAKNLSQGFGKAVVTLLEEFGSPDAEVLEAHYRANRRPDGRKWTDLLGYYRGQVIHRNYLGITREDKDKMWDALSLRDHLHDLLLRVIFQSLGYDGTYQPTVERLQDHRSLDWVTTGTSAAELGYR